MHFIEYLLLNLLLNIISGIFPCIQAQFILQYKFKILFWNYNLCEGMRGESTVRNTIFDKGKYLEVIPFASVVIGIDNHNSAVQHWFSAMPSRPRPYRKMFCDRCLYLGHVFNIASALFYRLAFLSFRFLSLSPYRKMEFQWYRYNS